VAGPSIVTAGGVGGGVVGGGIVGGGVVGGRTWPNNLQKILYSRLIKDEKTELQQVNTEVGSSRM